MFIQKIIRFCLSVSYWFRLQVEQNGRWLLLIRLKFICFFFQWVWLCLNVYDYSFPWFFFVKVNQQILMNNLHWIKWKFITFVLVIWSKFFVICFFDYSFSSMRKITNWLFCSFLYDCNIFLVNISNID